MVERRRRRRAPSARRTCTFLLVFPYAAIISMLLLAVSCSSLWRNTAGLGRHATTISRRRQLLQQVLPSANAFVVAPLPTSLGGCQPRTLAVQRWKPEPLRDHRQRQRQEQKEIAQAASKKKPYIVRRGTHLNSRRRRRDDTVLYRADRVLANRTGQSRRECFKLLQERRVFRVLGTIDRADDDHDSDDNTSRDDSNSNDDNNNQKFDSSPSLILEVVPGPKSKIAFSTPLRIDRRHDVPLPPPLLAVYHKPKWVLSVRRDPRGRRCLDHLFTGAYPWFTQTVQRREKDDGDNDSNSNRLTVTKTTKELLHPVGRLDYDTTGLLLFSSSGPLTQTLLHPKHQIEKEYVATVAGGTVDEEKLRGTLRAGVTTGAGVHKAKLLSAVPMESAQVKPYLESIRAGLPPEYNQTDLQLRGYLDVLEATELTTLTLTVKEGKHRMVRRILANAGHPVVSLHRQRLGAIALGDVPVGGVRQLTEEETKWARKVLYQESRAKRRDFLAQVEADQERAGDEKEKDADDEDPDSVRGEDFLTEEERSLLGGEMDENMQKFMMGEIDEEEYERQWIERQTEENEQAFKSAAMRAERDGGEEEEEKEAERDALEIEVDPDISKAPRG